MLCARHATSVLANGAMGPITVSEGLEELIDYFGAGPGR